MEKADKRNKITRLREDIYQVNGEKPSSHTYLVRGSDKNMLIDTGTTGNFPNLSECLGEIGLKIEDIHFILLTHEHSDHTGATPFFINSAVVCAHRLAANKIELVDEFVTMTKYLNTPEKDFYAHIWLEDSMFIDLGNYKFKIIHTPGHTSGCICIYETKEGFLFSGDTVFANGILSDIASSGNISDYVNSMEKLNTMKISELYPGHGRISHSPEQDIDQAVINARTMMEESKILFEALAKKTGTPPLLRAFLRKGKNKTAGESDGKK